MLPKRSTCTNMHGTILNKAKVQVHKYKSALRILALARGENVPLRTPYFHTSYLKVSCRWVRLLGGHKDCNLRFSDIGNNKEAFSQPRQFTTKLVFS